MIPDRWKQKLQSFWDAAVQAPLHTKLRLLRWNAPLLVLGLAAVHQIFVQMAVRPFPSRWSWWFELFVYSLTGSVVAWLGLTRIAEAVEQQAQAEAQLRAAFEELEINHEKLLALDALGQHITRAGSEQAVLELATQAPLHLTGARSSTMVTFDKERERLRLDVAWGLSENYLGALRDRLSAGVGAARCRSCTALFAKTSGDCPLFDGLQPLARSEGIGSLVCMPIANEQERVGILSAYFPSADGPPEDQLRLLNILGGVIANALDSLRTRARQANTVHTLHTVTAKTAVLDELAEQVLDVTAAGWEAPIAALFLYDVAGQDWQCRAGRGLPADPADPLRAAISDLAQQASIAGSPLVRPDLAAETGQLMRSAAAAPLVTEGQTLGVLILGSRQPHGFDERHIELLGTMAHQIALAVRNAQLAARLEETTVQAERNRLSREFHDGLAQTLGYLGLQSERLEGLIAGGRVQAAQEEIKELRQSIRGAYVDVREAIDGLRLSLDEPENLSDHLADYTAAFSRQSGIPAHFLAQPSQIATNAAVSLQLLRFAQEALTNVRKHAQAGRVEVQLQAVAGEIRLTVRDDGVGFPAVSTQDRVYRSHGLSSMRERVESLGGVLTISTGPQQGTRISASVPGEVRS